jgi:hypothetical protein
MNKEEINENAFLAEFLNEGLYLIPGDAPTAIGEKRREVEEPQFLHPPAVSYGPLRSYGEFKKNVLLITAESGIHFPSENQKNFFDKFLTALKLTWADVRLLDIQPIANKHDLLDDELDKHDYHMMLAFTGKNSAVASLLDLEPYKLQKASSRLLLLADTIDELENDPGKNKKRLLWTEVQKML